jgi:hypothetical protein
MNSHNIKEILAPLSNYSIYGSGSLSIKLIKLIRLHHLPEPDFIFDTNTSTSTLEGLSLIQLDKIDISLLTNVVLASESQSDEIRDRLMKQFGHDKKLNIICFHSSDIKRSTANDIHRINYVPHIGFLYCDGQYAPWVDTIRIFDGEMLIGEAELNFRNDKGGGWNSWRLEKNITIETGRIGAHFTSAGKLVDVCEHTLIGSLESTVQSFNFKGFPATVERDCIFLEFPGFNRAEKKNVSNQLFFEKLNEYLNINNWELVVISHIHSNVNFKTVDIGRGILPEGIIAELSSHNMFSDFRRKARESVRATACDHFFSEMKFNLNMDSFTRLFLEKSARFEAALREYRPKLYLAWTEFRPWSNTFRALCKAHEIPVLFLHEGFLPYTMQIDTCGEIALSYMCRKSEKFRALPIRDRDLENARKTLDFAIKQGSRNEFSECQKDVLESIEKARGKGKKIVFYACCNDWMMGLRPIWRQRAESLATPFVDSYDALSEMIRLCRANNWHLVVKPHPYYNSSQLLDIVRRHKAFTDLTISYLADPHAILNASDVLVTLMSSTAYEAMARGIPVVLLGGHPLRGQGVVYELTDTNDLSDLIKQALIREDWERREDAWLHFVARMIRYYLFPSTLEIEATMDKCIEHAARFILKRTVSGNWDSENIF